MMQNIPFLRGGEKIWFETPEVSFSGNAFLPVTAIVPVRQHAGSDARPLIRAGDRVREGQLIARSQDQASSNIHAPIPGILHSWKETSLPDGTLGLAAVIHLSGSFDILGRKEEHYPWQSSPVSEIFRLLEDRGAVNTVYGGAPLVPQMRALKQEPTRALILRAFDEDPTTMLDTLLWNSFQDHVLIGAAIIAKALEAKTTCILHHDKQWTVASPTSFEQLFPDSDVIPVKAAKKYPGGSIHRIFNILDSLKESIPSNRLVIDPSTALSVYDIIVKNQPIVQQRILVTGPAVQRTSFFTTRIGTTIGDVIEECGGFKSEPGRIIINGLLSGISIHDLDTPITKSVKSVHLLDHDASPDQKTKECIHCGLCLRVCPANLDPMRLAAGIRKNNESRELIESCERCQHCGCCAMVCPSRIPLHHIIREASFMDKESAE